MEAAQSTGNILHDTCKNPTNTMNIAVVLVIITICIFAVMTAILVIAMILVIISITIRSRNQTFQPIAFVQAFYPSSRPCIEDYGKYYVSPGLSKIWWTSTQ